MLRVEARHHSTTRASWVMAVIHCHRPDIYYCSKDSVCPVPSVQRGMVIQSSYRLFNCARCHRQVRICSHCDRGNRYCSPQCSYQARRDFLRRAGAVYQQTDQGKINHAARQQNYLIRKMTHQCSKQPPLDLSSHTTSQGRQKSGASKDTWRHRWPSWEYSDIVYCDFCGRPCAPLARLDFLRTRVPIKKAA